MRYHRMLRLKERFIIFKGSINKFTAVKNVFSKIKFIKNMLYNKKKGLSKLLMKKNEI